MRGDSGTSDDISIHAPPRGATLRNGRYTAATVVFQFTPLREGRRKPQKTRKRHAHFNSRPSARGDFVSGRVYRKGRDFNSRPSARGDMTLAIFLRPSIFQFTPLREGRLIPFPAPAAPTEFQFTPLREGRRVLHLEYWITVNDFNSRPSARGDTEIAGNGWKIIFISIHAPPRGATTA